MGSSGDVGIEQALVETPADADVEVFAEPPMSLTSFVGRDQELTELRSLFREGARLVTLTGIGGIGKTRLALELGFRSTELGWANVYFVELASVTNPGLIDNLVLESVGGGSSRFPLQAAVDYLREARALLVLDCCEHVVGAVGDVAEVLLRGCRSLAILATSRAPLDIPVELVWSVPALSMLAGGASGGSGVSEGARLFADRAGHVDAHFELNEEVLGLVETIVRRVDGIPLAIELAAARVRVLSPREIAESLNDHLRLLRSARRLDSRHQTIRDSLDWSFALLTSEEGQLFARLAIFSGGFDMDAATAVCGVRPINHDQMLDKVQGLLDKSLLVVESRGGATRFGMLDFVRQYASERLVISGEEPQVALRFRVYFRGLAERADRELWGLDAAGRARLDEESPNLRAAIDDGCRRAPEDAIAIVAALGLYWRLRGRLTEGVAATERSLAAAPLEPSRGNALALANLARLSFWLGDFSRTQSAAAAALEMSAAVGDIRSQAVALTPLGSLIIMGDPTRGDAILIEAAELARTAGDDVALCDAVAALAISYFFQDDSDAMRTALGESLRIAEAVGHEDAIRWCLWCSAHNALAAGELARARETGAQALAMMPGEDPLCRYCAVEILSIVDALTGASDVARVRAQADLEPSIQEGLRLGSGVLMLALGMAALAGGELDVARQWAATLYEREPEVRYLAWHAQDILVRVALARGDSAMAKVHANALLVAAEPLGNQRARAVGNLGLSRALLLEGDEQQAASVAHEALKILVERGWRLDVIEALDILAEVAVVQGQHDRAARLIASAERERSAIGLVAFPAAAKQTAATLATAAAILGEENLDRARREGAQMSLEEAVAYAQRGRGERASATHGWSSLSPVERQVVELATQGLSNPDIARELFMSRNTVKAHLSHTYTKLGVTNRTELARLATTHTRATTDTERKYPPG